MKLCFAKGKWVQRNSKAWLAVLLASMMLLGGGIGAVLCS